MIFRTCSCQIKELRELKAIGPGVFSLTGTTSALWKQHDREVWLTRIHGVQPAALFGGRIGVASPGAEGRDA